MAEQNHLAEYLENVYPEHGKLQVDDKGNLFAVVVDEEMDGFICRFNYDGCVEIDTEKLTYLSLSPNVLYHIANLIEEAEEIYRNRSDEEWDKYPD
jgi:hypothetical protein